MTITPLAKSYLKSIAAHADNPEVDTWFPCLGWDGTEVTLVSICPWTAAAGIPSLPPMFIQVELGFKNVPYVFIEPDSEKFFRNAHVDLDKDKRLVVSHHRNPNRG